MGQKYDRLTKQMQNEIDVIEQQFQDGLITLKERNDAIIEIERDAREYYREGGYDAPDYRDDYFQFS